MKHTFFSLILIFSFGFLFAQNSGNEMLSLTQIKKNVKTKRSAVMTKREAMATAGAELLMVRKKPSLM